MSAAGLKLGNLVNQPENWDFSGAAQLYAGVDLGTYKAITIIIDENGQPRAALMQRAEVVRSGLIVDYAGAQQIVRDMLAQLRSASRLPIEKGATSFPPQTESANVNATRYILEGAGIDVLNVLDEPSAANQILKLTSGAIVDVGGGTTGVAVIKNGKIDFTCDEATGGVHLSLVVAGNYKIDYEAAEKLKADPNRHSEIVPVVRPVIEKIASIVKESLEPFTDLSDICLVGGTCELDGFAEIVQDVLQINTFRPEKPQFITPLGIALSCLQAS